jgi:predicted nucleic acid-binding protein
VIYCDSSFLCALYLPGDKYEPIARSIAASFTERIPYSALNELELHNSIYRGVATRLFNTQTCAKLLRQVREDKANGLLAPFNLSFDAYFAQAMALTERFTAIHNCRTLDVLHVAAALLLEATQFASFDIRQRKMATELSLEVFPDQFKKDGIA